MRGSVAYRELLKTTTIIGGASFVNVAVAVVVAKTLAIFAGPQGVGLYGLYGGMVAMIASIAGIGTGGVRAIAAAHAKGNNSELASVAQALTWITFSIGLAIALIVLMLRRPLAEWVFDDPGQATAVGVLSIAIFMALCAASMIARLSGTGRLARLAQVTVWANIISGVTMVIGLRLAGLSGILVGVVATPALTMILSYLCLGGARISRGPGPLRAVRAHGAAIVRTGVALSASASFSGLSLLVVRSRINHVLGPESMGHFQAAWSVSMTYIGFALSAIALDYFPRLSGMSGDPTRMKRLLNQQTTMALVITTPIFIILFVFSPWIVKTLYSSDFHSTIPILRWQVLGDVFKIASWPLGYLLLAINREKQYLIAEIIWNVLFVTITWVLLPTLHIEATGVAFATSYSLYLALMLAMAGSRLHTCWNLANRTLMTCVIVALALLIIIKYAATRALIPVGGTLAVISIVSAILALRHMLSKRQEA